MTEKTPTRLQLVAAWTLAVGLAMVGACGGGFHWLASTTAAETAAGCNKQPNVGSPKYGWIDADGKRTNILNADRGAWSKAQRSAMNRQWAENDACRRELRASGADVGSPASVGWGLLVGAAFGALIVVPMERRRNRCAPPPWPTSRSTR